MNLLPKTFHQFSEKEYWDSFFKKRGSKAFEWYGEYPELSGHLHKYIKQQDDILITGCGNSTLGRDLYDIGYNKITNIDISQVVIRQMLSQTGKQRPNLKYLHMDAFEMSFSDESFSVVLDKGTLDALMPDDNAETKAKIQTYFSEIQRVLRVAGRYICVSLLQKHILHTLLEYFPNNNWMFRVVRCFEAEEKALQGGQNTMPVFLVICTKFKALPRKILELNLSTSDKLERYESSEEIIKHITSAQESAFICSSLKKTKIEGDEVSIDLYKPNDSKPRFTVFVVDGKFNAKYSQYAVFVVPQGREAEWLFSTKAGRQRLTTMTKTNRLAVVIMHRGQEFGDFEDIQHELNEAIGNLAPANLKNKKFLYLSLGEDMGKRTVRYEGSSEFSGPYIIEDVEVDGAKYRRLFYQSSQFVIQSEAKLKTIKTKRESKEIVDLNYLTCTHHTYMSIATHLACRSEETSSIVVIGLGGGGLCSFLRRFVPKATITAVDIDPEMLEVAKHWFGLCVDENMRVVIQDGVKFLEKMAAEGGKSDAVLFDVDSKDSTIGMSCPPKQFLENEVLENVIKIIGNGVFILNLVLRDSNLRPSIVSKLREKFKTVFSYRLTEDLNEIFLCSQDSFSKEGLGVSAKAINSFFKKNHCEDSVEVDEYLNNLNILK